MEFTEQQKKDWRFLPEGVVEDRYNRKTMSYDGFVAEVAFYGKHYILSDPLPTREEAEKIGNDKALEMKNAMIKTALSLVSGFKEAKA